VDAGRDFVEASECPSEITISAKSASLETVFRVLKSVATGSNVGGHVAGSRPLDIDDPDPSVDNVGEHLSTLSPPHSPLSSPIKDGYNQRSPNAKAAPAPGENEANIRSVRLAARMVGD